MTRGFTLKLKSPSSSPHLKALGLGQQKVEAAKPVSENQQDVYEVDDTPKIGPNGSALNNVIILNSSINLFGRVEKVFGLVERWLDKTIKKFRNSP
jgi:hypothetical protein